MAIVKILDKEEETFDKLHMCTSDKKNTHETNDADDSSVCKNDKKLSHPMVALVDQHLRANRLVGLDPTALAHVIRLGLTQFYSGIVEIDGKERDLLDELGLRVKPHSQFDHCDAVSSDSPARIFDDLPSADPDDWPFAQFERPWKKSTHDMWKQFHPDKEPPAFARGG